MPDDKRAKFGGFRRNVLINFIVWIFACIFLFLVPSIFSHRLVRAFLMSFAVFGILFTMVNLHIYAFRRKNGTDK